MWFFVFIVFVNFNCELGIGGQWKGSLFPSYFDANTFAFYFYFYIDDFLQYFSENSCLGIVKVHFGFRGSKHPSHNTSTFAPSPILSVYSCPV